MKKIYKYELPVNGGTIVISDPIEEVLELQNQNGIPVMWAIVDTDIEKENVKPVEIVSIGTGWELPKEYNKYRYLGTVQDKYGYVWHYFTTSLLNQKTLPKYLNKKGL